MEGKGLRVSMLHGREVMGEGRGGGYPWGSTPLSLHIFSILLPLPFFLYFFFRYSPPKIKIFPQAHLTPAHFSSKAPLPPPPPPNPQALILHVFPYETCASPADSDGMSMSNVVTVKGQGQIEQA